MNINFRLAFVEDTLVLSNMDRQKHNATAERSWGPSALFEADNNAKLLLASSILTGASEKHLASSVSLSFGAMMQFAGKTICIDRGAEEVLGSHPFKVAITPSNMSSIFDEIAKLIGEERLSEIIGDHSTTSAALSDEVDKIRQLCLRAQR